MLSLKIQKTISYVDYSKGVHVDTNLITWDLYSLREELIIVPSEKKTIISMRFKPYISSCNR